MKCYLEKVILFVIVSFFISSQLGASDEIRRSKRIAHASHPVQNIIGFVDLESGRTVDQDDGSEKIKKGSKKGSIVKKIVLGMLIVTGVLFGQSVYSINPKLYSAIPQRTAEHHNSKTTSEFWPDNLQTLFEPEGFSTLADAPAKKTNLKQSKPKKLNDDSDEEL